MALLHFYGINNGNPTYTENNKWFKDENSILKKIFTDGMLMYKTILIHPNGSFYLRLNKILFSEEKKYFKYKTFEKFKKKWIKKYKKFS